MTGRMGKCLKAIVSCNKTRDEGFVRFLPFNIFITVHDLSIPSLPLRVAPETSESASWSPWNASTLASSCPQAGEGNPLRLCLRSRCQRPIRLFHWTTPAAALVAGACVERHPGCSSLRHFLLRTVHPPTVQGYPHSQGPDAACQNDECKAKRGGKEGGGGDFQSPARIEISCTGGRRSCIPEGDSPQLFPPLRWWTVLVHRSMIRVIFRLHALHLLRGTIIIITSFDIRQLRNKKNTSAQCMRISCVERWLSATEFVPI